MRRPTLGCALAAALVVGGCGGGGAPQPPVVPGRVLHVYTSLPFQGDLAGRARGPEVFQVGQIAQVVEDQRPRAPGAGQPVFPVPPWAAGAAVVSSPWVSTTISPGYRPARRSSPVSGRW